MLRKHPLKNLRRRLALEPLEDRVLLSAGTIHVAQNAQGVVTLTGDNNDDQIVISPNGLMGLSLFSENLSTIIFDTPNTSLTGATGLVIQFGNGNDQVEIDSVNFTNLVPGSIVINLANAATGSDTISLNNDTFQQADITSGQETSGAMGANNVAIFRCNILGDHLNVSLLNESGLSGQRLAGGTGSGPGSVNSVFMSGLTFFTGGNLNLRVDDGVPYVVSNVRQSASVVSLDTALTGGNANAALGDHFQDVEWGTGSIGASTNILAHNVGLSVGSDNDTVRTVAEVTSSELVSVGNVSLYNYDAVGLPPATVFVGGTVGKGGLNVNLGSNANPNLPNGWPMEITETDLGNLNFTGGDGLAALIDPTSVGELMDITMGSGGVNGLEALTLLGCSCTDPNITFHSKKGDTVHMTFDTVVVTDPNAQFFLTDLGQGIDLVVFNNVHVAGRLMVFLSNSGHNIVAAHNFTVGLGFIFGGAGVGDQYLNFGGNSGFFVLGFP